jgi:hypothetical protein
VEPDYIAKHFIPLALDTYFRGDSHELAFCEKAGAGGNHLVAVTAAGAVLGSENLRLREQELASVVEKYAKLSKDERTPPLPDSKTAAPPKRPVPAPPDGGLILRGYCTYLKQNAKGQFERANPYYYAENPDRWMTETQSDLLWLTKAERESLVPTSPRVGQRHDVSTAVQKRFYSTIAIDYMEGSVNSLPVRESTMTLTVEAVDEKTISLRLDGSAELGKAFAAKGEKESNTRGCEVRVLGRIAYDRAGKKFDRFDIVGIGRGWGNKMEYLYREIRVAEEPWMYGIACELVKGDAPQDLIPPYNLLHYNSTGPYFETNER